MLSEVDALAQALSSTSGNSKKARARLLEAARGADASARTEAIRRLAPLIRMDDAERACVAASVCGTLTELGADPEPMAEPLLARTLPALRKLADAPPAEPPVESRGVPASETTVKPAARPGLFRTLWRLGVGLYRLRRAAKERQARMTGEERTLVQFGLPLITLFCARPSLRAAHAEVGELARASSDRVENCHWLETVFAVREDEPLLVIEPSTQTGILARLSGTDVNFSLSMLLMAHFPATGASPQPRIAPEAAIVLSDGPQCSNVCVTGCWNMHDWRAIRPDRSVPEGQADTAHWIWNEGTPADIPEFEGRRVVLLGPPAYPRTWAAQRTLAALKPSLRIESVLTPGEVSSWLDRMIEARGEPS